jgi:foldase protein PrsA
MKRQKFWKGEDFLNAKQVKSSKVVGKKGKTGPDPENIVRYSIYGISGVVAVCLLLAVVFLIIPNTVATAGDYKISRDEYIFFHTQVLNSYYMNYNTNRLSMDEFLKQDLGGGITVQSAAIASATQQVHDYAVYYDLARKNGVSLTQEEINNMITSLRNMMEEPANQYGVSINTISKANYGLPFRKVVKIYEKVFLGDKYANQTVQNKEFTEEEYQSYYEENKDLFDRVTARHILLKINEGDSEVKIQGLQKKAEDILQSIKDGEADFEAMVEEYSEDTASVPDGGKFTFRKNQMVEEFEKFCFENEPGTIDIVRTEYGFHIIEVMEHLFGYEANKDIVKSQMPAIKFNEEIKALKEGEYAINFRSSFGSLFE